MKFFDSLINDVNEIICPYEKKTLPYEREKIWTDSSENHIILSRDTRVELSGVGFNLFTSKGVKDEVVVIGDDLHEISSDRSFARICIVEIDDVEDEQSVYNLIKKVDYVKYHCFPNGYMIRSTSRQHKEAVRVSFSAVKNGIDFWSLGNLYISKYKENPRVKGVQVIFITEKAVDSKVLEEIAEKNHKIAEALNHIMNNIMFDCDTCSLKAVCDEVEGMKELHFKRSNDE